MKRQNHAYAMPPYYQPLSYDTLPMSSKKVEHLLLLLYSISTYRLESFLLCLNVRLKYYFPCSADHKQDRRPQCSSYIWCTWCAESEKQQQQHLFHSELFSRLGWKWLAKMIKNVPGIWNFGRLFPASVWPSLWADWACRQLLHLGDTCMHELKSDALFLPYHSDQAKPPVVASIGGNCCCSRCELDQSFWTCFPRYFLFFVVCN